MDIRILPSNVANMIAAGEVVQRPASVVKELVENAVDAGASQISVVVKDAGRTLIQVIDNGVGMSPDEAVVCFERHATSKIITAEDLMDIHTYGFRGEALASIAAVAQVCLKTRRENDELGVQVEFADSIHLSTQEVSVPVGCNFMVRDLFYNVPARRKFLKSDNVEFKHIVSEFSRVALTRPDIGFTLVHNDKEIFVLRPAKSHKFRIQDLIGASVIKDIVDISAHTSVVTVNGYIGRPDAAKKTTGNQYFFINGRFFKSAYLHKAVMKAYENMVPDGVTPSYFIYMDVDPQNVDVNIHPTKTEIKFEDDSVIFQTLYACIKEALGRHAFENIDFDAAGIPDVPVFSRSFDDFRPEENLNGDALSYNPFENDGYPNVPSEFTNVLMSADGEVPQRNAFPGHQYHPVEKRDDYGKLFEDKSLSSRQILILKGKYLLIQSSSGLMVINVQRATERILYEKFLDALSKNDHVTQNALFPVSVYVGVENMCIFKENQQLLSSLGFAIEQFGEDTVVVNGVPEGYSAEPEKVQTMIADLLLVLSDDASSLPGLMLSNMANRFAKLGSMNMDSISNPVEAQRLIDRLFSCENMEFTNSGKRIAIVMNIEEIENKF